MANFTTHIAVGTVVSGAAATLTLAADVIAPESLVAVTLAGVVGSVLPDIDLKEFTAGPGAVRGARGVPVVLRAVRGGAEILDRGDVDRLARDAGRGALRAALAVSPRSPTTGGSGIRSWPALFFWFLTAVIFHQMLGFHEGVAWLAGGFVFVGYMTHLILDEIYSVDVYETRIKASFGTALKLYDGKRLGESAVVAGLAVLAFMATPPAKPFVDGITSQQLWAGLQSRLLPQQHWFGIDIELSGRG